MGSSEQAMIEAIPAVITRSVVVVSIIFPLLSLFAFGLRILARRDSKQPLLADDWMMGISWIFCLGSSIIVWSFANITGIDHYWKVDVRHGVEYSTMFVLVQASYIQFPLAAVKIAILLFYMRIFTTRYFKPIGWFTIAMVASWCIIFFVLLMLQSNPVRGSWTGEGYLRFDTFALGLAQVGSSIALDVLILCFPIPVIFGLHMKGRRKVAVALIFWLGIFCCIAASIRLWLIYTSTLQVLASQGEGYDAIYYQSKNMIFAIIEPNCSVIAGCLPCLGPLIQGGRSTESLVRSVRSVFSLRSKASRRDPDEDGTNGRKDSNSSNMELKQAAKDWNSSQGGFGVVTDVHSKNSTDRDVATAQQAPGRNQIQVTYEYNVSSH